MTTQPTVTVHLMRHGEVHNPERIVYGRLPHYALSEKGQHMVRMSAQEFAQRAQDGAKIVHLVCSPLLRTRESAAPITELLGLEAHADQRVIEADNYFEGEHVTFCTTVNTGANSTTPCAHPGGNHTLTR